MPLPHTEVSYATEKVKYKPLTADDIILTFTIFTSLSVFSTKQSPIQVSLGYIIVNVSFMMMMIMMMMMIIIRRRRKKIRRIRIRMITRKRAEPNV